MRGSSAKRELYIDAFRGLMALVMVQGHVFEALLSPEARANALYQLELIFHGSTAPGFLFASGFVAGLPRAPLSLKASLRRARRLLFVLGTGYALHLPYFSLWKVLYEASPSQRAALYACDALQVIAVSQLLVLGLQWLAGALWTRAATLLTLLVLGLSPVVWSAHLSERIHPALGAYLDMFSGSHFPFYPFGAFVLAGTVAGAALGRQEPAVRRRRAFGWGAGLLALGLMLAALLAGRVDFWTVSPAYVCLRLGGLLLLLIVVESATRRGITGLRLLALLGHETFQVFVLHLYLLYGWILSEAPLGAYRGRLGFAGAGLALLVMLPALLGAAAAWHAAKARAPREASLLLAFVTTAFVYEFLTRPW
jgi:fucose 4-O-acetylase-like acetyltransferase